MLSGNIDVIDGVLCVKYSTTFDEPILHTVWWKIDDVDQKGNLPNVGDVVSRIHGPWLGNGFHVYVAGNSNPIKVERVPIPCPVTKKPTRWHNNCWEKKTSKGWVTC